MCDVIKSAKVVMEHVLQGWELWHTSPDALPGRWDLRRGRERKQVHWCAIEVIQRHYLAWFDQNTEEHQEGRFNWSYVPKQRSLMGMA